MNNINLSDAIVEDLFRSFGSLQKAPEFSISEDIDVNIVFFRRKDKYFGIRTGLKTDFESREEFLVYSFLVEEVRAHTKNMLSLENLKAEQCSDAELKDVYRMGERTSERVPHISNIKQSYVIVNNSALNWTFLEEKNKYHSVFWIESESKLFGRCA